MTVAGQKKNLPRDNTRKKPCEEADTKEPPDSVIHKELAFIPVWSRSAVNVACSFSMRSVVQNSPSSSCDDMDGGVHLTRSVDPIFFQIAKESSNESQMNLHFIPVHLEPAMSPLDETLRAGSLDSAQDLYGGMEGSIFTVI